MEQGIYLVLDGRILPPFPPVADQPDQEPCSQDSRDHEMFVMNQAIHEAFQGGSEHKPRPAHDDRPNDGPDDIEDRESCEGQRAQAQGERGYSSQSICEAEAQQGNPTETIHELVDTLDLGPPPVVFAEPGLPVPAANEKKRTDPQPRCQGKRRE